MVKRRRSSTWRPCPGTRPRTSSRRPCPTARSRPSTRTDVTKGETTAIKGTVSLPGGGTQTITGGTVQRSSQSVTAETITNPAGQVYHDRIVITHTGALSQSETNMTIGPDGSVSSVKSVMTTVLNPSAVGQSAAPTYLGIPTPAVQALNLEAQMLAPPSATTDEPTVQPVALPEPSTLTFLGMVLLAAGLRRGWQRIAFINAARAEIINYLAVRNGQHAAEQTRPVSSLHPEQLAQARREQAAPGAASRPILPTSPCPASERRLVFRQSSIDTFGGMTDECRAGAINQGARLRQGV